MHAVIQVEALIRVSTVLLFSSAKFRSNTVYNAFMDFQTYCGLIS